MAMTRFFQRSRRSIGSGATRSWRMSAATPTAATARSVHSTVRDSSFAWISASISAPEPTTSSADPR